MPRDRDTVGNPQWMLALLPAFPLILLILRLWYLSGQDVQTMLLLVQHVSPLGLVSTMMITLLWSVPAVILVARVLGTLLKVSAPGTESWLTTASTRTPDWVVVAVGVLAALIWQLRFLPTLLMLLLIDLGLEARVRHPDRHRVIWATCVALPLCAGAAAYAWLAPAVVEAFGGGEPLTVTLLALPPALTVLLTGPVPARMARPVTHTVAIGGLLLAPLLVSGMFLRAPVLPTVALEVDGDPADGRAPEVLIGEVVSADDTMTAIMGSSGAVRFVPNGQLMSKVLCRSVGRPPYSRIDVHGWQVEETMLSWMAPRQPRNAPDPRCEGRPQALPLRR